MSRRAFVDDQAKDGNSCDDDDSGGGDGDDQEEDEEEEPRDSELLSDEDTDDSDDNDDDSDDDTDDGEAANNNDTSRYAQYDAAAAALRGFRRQISSLEDVLAACRAERSSSPPLIHWSAIDTLLQRLDDDRDDAELRIEILAQFVPLLGRLSAAGVLRVTMLAADGRSSRCVEIADVDKNGDCIQLSCYDEDDEEEEEKDEDNADERRRKRSRA